LGIIILFFVVWGVSGYLRKVFVVHAENIYRQNYAPIFEWLNKNTVRFLAIGGHNRVYRRKK